MDSAVLDASALLAVLNAEPGADVVAEAIAQGTAMSTVNYAEVVTKLRDDGVPLHNVQTILEPLGINVVDFTAQHALRTGDLRPETRTYGLSLGDRACIALAEALHLPVYTSDRNWQFVGMSVPLRFIR